jgi:S1-C subfamily serine protease
MNPATVLQEWSEARASLSASLAPKVVGLVAGRHRSVSGIRWRGNLIVTAAEALDGSEEAIVVSSEGEQQLPVVACDLATDVAVLRAAADVPTPAQSQGASTLEAGGGVVFAGRSRRGPLAAFGTVRLSGPAWSSRRGGAIDQRLEFEGNLDSRFEGALVADFSGVTQAMLVAGPHRTLLGIPASTIERIVTLVERHGYLPRPYLGLRLQSLWLDDATRARWGLAGRAVAAVAGIESGSPAEAAGVIPGDLLESVDGVAVEDIEAVAARIARSSVDQTLDLCLRRGGEPVTLKVKVAEWRANRT